MYKPDSNGVWVALARLNWSWRIKIDASKTPVGRSGADFTFDKAGTPVTTEWPEWTGTTRMAWT